MSLCTDSTTNKSCFDSPFGHYVRVLVDMEISNELKCKILVERQSFTFFVELEYKNLPKFCSLCNYIGHNIDKCRRNKVGGELGDMDQKNVNSFF